jgi:CRISPR-associated endonuclease Csn1
LYDGKEIDRNDVIRNPQNWRIDHIIPYSISFMDNKNNKVLTKTETNKNKGNLTPYQ